MRSILIVATITQLAKGGIVSFDKNEEITWFILQIKTCTGQKPSNMDGYTGFNGSTKYEQ